ncbi:MAG: shikimate kinase [Gemmataceae bacterium]|nr:shikimate kinase [Gemmataceae bacterium]
MNPRFYLVGLRATGKSTVGRLLAKRLNWAFFDTDEEVERRTGLTIREVFSQKGEAVFRELESEVLLSMSRQTPAVIATGGGIVLSESNRQLLKQTGRVLWLHAPPAILWQRMQADPTTSSRRPNLAAGGVAELESLAQARTPLYEEVAHEDFDTSSRIPEAIVEEIVNRCRISY